MVLQSARGTSGALPNGSVWGIIISLFAALIVNSVLRLAIGLLEGYTTRDLKAHRSASPGSLHRISRMDSGPLDGRNLGTISWNYAGLL